jgi:hypothetical protein
MCLILGSGPHELMGFAEVEPGQSAPGANTVPPGLSDTPEKRRLLRRLARLDSPRIKVETICGRRGILIAAREIVRATATPQVLVISRCYLARRAAVTRIVGPRFREIASSKDGCDHDEEGSLPSFGAPRQPTPEEP